MGTRRESGVGIYRGYSERQYDSYVLHRQYIPLSDGVRLGASILIPATGGKEEKRPLPVILHYTPYPFVRVGQAGTLIFFDNLEAMELLPYGYVLAEVEVRGTGISFGSRQVVNSRQEAADGAEAVEWLASQPFCSGKIGTIGWSYHGQTQLSILSQKPEHLTACVIGMTDFNRYDGWVRDGIPRAFGSQPDTVWEKEPALTDQIERMALQEYPVPEDPDRVLVRQAIREHTANGLQVPIQRDLVWRDSYDLSYGGAIWETLSASTYREELDKAGVPLYLLGGIYDVFRRDTILMYHNLKQARKLTFGPWYHVGKKKNPSPWIEMLRWMDYWLKGIDNGVMQEKPISLCVGHYDFTEKCHDGENSRTRRDEDTWPLTEGLRHIFYFHADRREAATSLEQGSLREIVAEEGHMEYQAVYGISTSVESKFTISDDGRGADQFGITFSTSPMEQDMTFLGHPMAYLTFEVLECGDLGEKSDLDFFVTVSDYDPVTDTAFQFDDGHLRASLREESDDCPYDFLGLPWHENRRGSNHYLSEGEQISLKIDLMPVFYTVRRGHCLRVSVENSQDRMYYTGRLEYEKDPCFRAPRYRLLLGGEDGCRIEMPDIYETSQKGSV